MTTHIAKSPQEFREMVLELEAGSIRYLVGNNKREIHLWRPNAHLVEMAFNDCIKCITANASRSNGEREYIPISLEAVKKNVVVMTGQWSIVPVAF